MQYCKMQIENGAGDDDDEEDDNDDDGADPEINGNAEKCSFVFVSAEGRKIIQNLMIQNLSYVPQK